MLGTKNMVKCHLTVCSQPYLSPAACPHHFIFPCRWSWKGLNCHRQGLSCPELCPLPRHWIRCSRKRQRQNKLHQIATKRIPTLVPRGVGKSYQVLPMVATAIDLTGFPPMALFRKVPARSSETECECSKGLKQSTHTWGLSGQIYFAGVFIWTS